MPSGAGPGGDAARASQAAGDPARPYVGHTQRYGVLLLVVVAAFAIEGTAAPKAWSQVVLSVLLGAGVILALWAAEARPRVLRPITAIVLAVIVFTVVEVAQGAVDVSATRLANAILVALAPPAIVVGVIRGLRARQAVTLQAVLGVLCVYILVGMFFAAWYGAIEKLGHEPFFAQGGAATVPRTLYFSFTTLTTTGYGDLTARTNLGHTVSVSEALLGQVYLVTVVSLLVANLRPRRMPPA